VNNSVNKFRILSYSQIYTIKNSAETESMCCVIIGYFKRFNQSRWHRTFPRKNVGQKLHRGWRTLELDCEICSWKSYAVKHELKLAIAPVIGDEPGW